MSTPKWTEFKQWQTTIPGGQGWVNISKGLGLGKTDYYWTVTLVDLDSSNSPHGFAFGLRDAKAAGLKAAHEALEKLRIARGGA